MSLESWVDKALRRLVCACMGHSYVWEPVVKVTFHEAGMTTKEVFFIRRCPICGDPNGHVCRNVEELIAEQTAHIQAVSA